MADDSRQADVDTQVLIAGGGPADLAPSLSLSRLGMPNVIMHRFATTAQTHARTSPISARSKSCADWAWRIECSRKGRAYLKRHFVAVRIRFGRVAVTVSVSPWLMYGQTGGHGGASA